MSFQLSWRIKVFSSGFKRVTFFHASIVQSLVFTLQASWCWCQCNLFLMIRDWLVLGSSVSRVFWKSVLMFTGCLSAMFLSTSCWLSLSTTFMLMSWVCNKRVLWYLWIICPATAVLHDWSFIWSTHVSSSQIYYFSWDYIWSQQGLLMVVLRCR